MEMMTLALSMAETDPVPVAGQTPGLGMGLPQIPPLWESARRLRCTPKTLLDLTRVGPS